MHARVNNRYMIYVMNNLLYNTDTGYADLSIVITGSIFAAIFIIILLLSVMAVIIYRCKQKHRTCHKPTEPGSECGRFNMMVL